MIKHEMVNDDVLSEVANKYMSFFSQINEYADYTAKTVDNMKDFTLEILDAAVIISQDDGKHKPHPHQ